VKRSVVVRSSDVAHRAQAADADHGERDERRERDLADQLRAGRPRPAGNTGGRFRRPRGGLAFDPDVLDRKQRGTHAEQRDR
jgi:hypothetical protein